MSWGHVALDHSNSRCRICVCPAPTSTITHPKSLKTACDVTKTPVVTDTHSSAVTRRDFPTRSGLKLWAPQTPTTRQILHLSVFLICPLQGGSWEWPTVTHAHFFLGGTPPFPPPTAAALSPSHWPVGNVVLKRSPSDCRAFRPSDCSQHATGACVENSCAGETSGSFCLAEVRRRTYPRCNGSGGSPASSPSQLPVGWVLFAACLWRLDGWAKLLRPTSSSSFPIFPLLGNSDWQGGPWRSNGASTVGRWDHSGDDGVGGDRRGGHDGRAGDRQPIMP